MKLHNKKDLTRWNRAGLSEFHYIHGNAITYLETLRQKLVEEYDDGNQQAWKELVDRFPESASETQLQNSKRLSAQYYDERRDYAWEILRSFSRSSHVLGEYINAYANEAYLPTAVEWDNVRKLVALLDYRPAPPASAETTIALLFKEGESGKVDKGFAVKNKPDKGEATVIFETREKLEGSASVNRLQLKDWDKNSTLLKSHSNKKWKPHYIKKRKKNSILRFYLQQLTDDINVGDLGILATSKEGIAVKVAAFNNDKKKSYIDLKLISDNIPDKFTLYDTTLYLQPDFVSSPLANGHASARFEKDASVNEGEIIFAHMGDAWHARRIVKNELRHVEFKDSKKSPQAGEQILRAHILKRQKHVKLGGGAYLYLLPEDFSDTYAFFVNDKLEQLSVSITDEPVDKVKFRYILGSFGEQIYYPGSQSEGSIQQANLKEIRFAGKVTDVKSGDWALVYQLKKHNKKGQQSKSVDACLIEDIAVDEEWFTLNLDCSTQSVSLLRSSFKLSLKHKDYNINHSPAWHAASNDSITVLELEKAALAKELKLGQKLICACDALAVVVELKDVKGSALHLSPPFHLQSQAGAFTRNNTLIYANAVRATHGETQPEKIVGNGDASQTSQCFELASDKISWVADAAFSTGVRADLSLRVGQRVWQQVEDLSLSSHEDHHYQVNINEDDTLSVCFGNGRGGRRLPTGIDNVRVSYRVGYGEEGNLEPHKLVKIAKPDLLLEDFVAPLASSGGARKESSSSMRESAPATVLALKRAVSIDDFSHLAANHSMVWQARAFEKMPDRPARSKIEVVVVAAGGKEFITNSDTSNLIRNFLAQHSAPGTPISVVSYKALFMQLKLSIMVDETAYDKKQVEAAVSDYLKVHLEIKQRQLGEALFRNDIIALLEQVEGVENGHCEILAGPFSAMSADSKPGLHKGDDGKIRKVAIKQNQLIYLDTRKYPLKITSVAYEI